MYLEALSAVHSNQNLDAIGYRESVENSESCSEE
jgi:hypothetical protein